MTVPADASSLIAPAPDQLCEHPEIAPQEVAGLLERLAQVPDPRAPPRGVRHPLNVVLALAACAVLAGATLLTVGEWITAPHPRCCNMSACGWTPCS
ncbi:transposase family protein [Streptomyces bluensis]|uniref:Transposase family protein n=1 Tax=Streptomyces bluensis TaxID=33897 RepID=A0ABW6UGT8_9ACTN